MLATTHPATEPRAGWDRRAVGALSRVRRAGRGCRWAPLAAAVALVALGFVPFPLGSAEGALDRALAAAGRAATLHVRVRSDLHGHHISWEEWWSADGFHRYQDELEDGVAQSVVVEDTDRAIRYHADRQVPGRGWRTGADTDRGPGIATFSAIMGERGRIDEFFGSLAQRTGWPVREFRVISGWGGAVDVTEAEGTVADDHTFGFLTTFDVGERVRVRVESDPRTGRFRRLEEFVLQHGAWERTLWTECVEWDKPIPAKAHQFAFPPGTVVSRLRWWQKRTEQVLARGETPDWNVSLHALDVNRVGDLYLTLSRDARPGMTYDVPLVVAEARDDAGGRYILESRSVIRTWLAPKLRRTEGSILQEGYFPRSYWALELIRVPEANGSRPPTQVTVTVYADGDTAKPVQAVTFGPLALPARQEGLRLFREAESIARE